MQIEPQDPKHKKIIELVQNCHKLSKKFIEQRYDAWEKCDSMDQTFIRPEEKTADGKKKNPFETKVFIPMSRACKDTILTFWMQVFTGKRPMFKLQGRGPEDVKAAKLNEIILDYQAERKRAQLMIYSFLNDNLKYGLANVKNLYKREYAWVNVQKPVFPTYPFMGAVEYESTKERKMVYEGPDFTNTDNYNFFPDPRVPASKVQEGQFVGYGYSRSYYYLKKQEQSGVYYNIEHLKTIQKDTTGEEGYGFDEHRNKGLGISSPNENQNMALDQKNPHFDIKEFWIEIIPKDYELSETNHPEIWVFTIANDQVVIRANASVYDHGKFPCVSSEFDYDGHSLFSPSFYESVEGLQDLMNWLYNSHMDNVRKFLNDALVVDPKAVNIRDIIKPTPAKIIRLKKELWGKGVSIDSVIKQLQVHDVTGNHLKDANSINDILQRRAHTSDAMQGAESEIKRTATEIAKMSSSGTNHLQMSAMLVYAQAIIPLIEMSVQNNQQFLSEARYYRILGDYAKDVVQPDPNYTDGSALQVSPDEIQGYFDFPVDDGRMPMNPADNAELWLKAIEVAGSLPPVMAQMDAFALYKEFLNSMGVKNVDDFRIQANVLPDAQIEGMVDSGNVIPMPGGMPQ